MFLEVRPEARVEGGEALDYREWEARERLAEGQSVYIKVAGGELASEMLFAFLFSFFPLVLAEVEG